MQTLAQEEVVTTTVCITKEIIHQSLPHQSRSKSRGKEHGRDASIVQFLDVKVVAAKNFV